MKNESPGIAGARMRDDWDRRAKEDARWHIATNSESASAETFHARAVVDVEKFFSGIESSLHEEQDVLDLGCGVGRLAAVLAPRVRSVLGVDVSGEMLDQAKEWCRDMPNVRFLQNDGVSLAGVPDGTIGLLMSYVVLHHIPRWATLGYVGEARRVLRPGGEIVLQVPTWREGVAPTPPDDKTFEIRYYEEAEILGVLNHLGFVEASITPDPDSKPDEPFLGIRVHARVAAG